MNIFRVLFDECPEGIDCCPSLLEEGGCDTQGENCIEDVCNSIDIANKDSLSDIILLARGGGSEECAFWT